MIPCRDEKVLPKGLLRLTTAYQRLPNIQAVLSAMLRQCQLLESATYDVINSRMIGLSRVPVPLVDIGCCDGPAPNLTNAVRTAVVLDATGVYIDPIGELVNELRGGRSDADYLVAIKAKILVNKSAGLAENLIQILIAAVPYGTITTYSEPAEATVLLGVYGFTPVNTLATLLTASRMGGVRGILEYSTEAFTNLFVPTSTHGGVTGNGPASIYGGTPTGNPAAVVEF